MIDLGEKIGSAPCCEAPTKDETYYPSINIECKEGEPSYDIPESGTMLVTFKRTRVEETEDERGKRHSCTLKLKSIDEINGQKPVAEGKKMDTEALLDKLRSELEED